MKSDIFPYGVHVHQDLYHTQKLGRTFSKLLFPGHTLGLSGALGAGKTTFAKSIIKGLCPSVSFVVSPSFPLMIPYEYGNFTLWHMDLFRLSHASEKDLEDLGIPELLARHPCIIEWPDYLHKINGFQKYTLCTFSFEEKEDYRTISIQNVPI